MRSGGRHRPCLPRTCGRPRHACRSTRSRLCQAARSHRGFCPRALQLCQQQRGRSRLHRRTRPLNPRRLRLLSRPRERAPCGQVGATRRTNRAAFLCVCVSSCAACCDRLLVSCWSRWESRTPSRATCVAAGINRAALSMGCSNYGSLMPTGPSKLVVDAQQHGCAQTSDASAGDLNKPAARLCACAFRAQISVHVCMRIPCANLCARVLACARECACSCGFMRIHAVLSCRGLVSRKRVQAPVARPRHGEEAAALRVAKAASS